MTLERPLIDPPEGTPPAELEITEITLGEGDVAIGGHIWHMYVAKRTTTVLVNVFGARRYPIEIMELYVCRDWKWLDLDDSSSFKCWLVVHSQTRNLPHSSNQERLNILVGQDWLAPDCQHIISNFDF